MKSSPSKTSLLTESSGDISPRLMNRIGIIFDWDGVIINSSSCHERSWEILAAEEGQSLPPDHFRRGFGMKNDIIISDFLRWASVPSQISRLSLRKEEIFRSLLSSLGISLIRGIKAFLARLEDAGVPCAIGSSTDRKNITTVLAAEEMAGYFRAIVSSEDVQKGKPHPQVFLLAAERLGLPPDRCIVIEDTHVGIEAAQRGGMKTVAVTTTHPAESFPMADLVVNGFEQLAVGRLRRLVPPYPEGASG